MANRPEGKSSWISRILTSLPVIWAWLVPARKATDQSRQSGRGAGRGPSRWELPQKGSLVHPDELHHLSSLASLSIIIIIAMAFVAWGIFVFYTVGAKWPPPWNFGEVQDLPGASVYSTERASPPEPQHVMGRPGSGPARGDNP